MSDNNEALDMEMEYDILTLVDEDGDEHEFELVDTAELDGQNYMALIPVFDGPEETLDDSGELVIMKVVAEDGEEFLDAIEDEEEYNRASDFFTERLADVFDFEDDIEEIQ